MALRVMVYSHDTFGLGNIRRMLAVSEHLLDSIPGVSVLLVTGSPVVHEFRLRQGLDYIKLPCISREGRDEYSAKTLGTGIAQLMQLRAGLILSAARDFEPHVVLIDKKPDGVKHELRPTLDYLKNNLPDCRAALVLRDILDTPEVTKASWAQNGFEQTLKNYFNAILILGDPRIFDAAREYGFSSALRRMVTYCGYARRAAPHPADCAATRRRLLAGAERLVLVTPGGGADGWSLVSSYVDGAGKLPGVRSVIVCGPEMRGDLRQSLKERAAGHPAISILEFSGEMLTYMGAADAVVSMAGYNTICEIISLGKRAVVVPRAHPVQEQWIRAERLARLGLLRAIHPDALTPQLLAKEVQRQLDAVESPVMFPASLDGLEVVAKWARPPAPRVEREGVLGRRLAWHASHTY